MLKAIDAALEGPARRGRSRLAAAALIAALAVFAAVAIVGKSPKLRAALASRRSPETAVVAVAPPSSGEALAATDALPGEDGFDLGEDGDFVDDTLPGAQPSAPAIAAPEVQPAPAPAPPPPVEKPRHRKHGVKGSTKTAAKPDDASAKKDKPKHKRKAKPAEPQ
jgi:hypothetical protein